MKKFRNFIAEEMSVTLKQHGSTSYKVHAVGSKMKQHGGFKVGDTVHDHHIDDLHDSGIKVRYHKESVDVKEDYSKGDPKSRAAVEKKGYSHGENEDGDQHGQHRASHDGQHHYASFISGRENEVHHYVHDEKSGKTHVFADHEKTPSGVNSKIRASVQKANKEHINEAIERKADVKMIMVKDPITGRTVLKKAPRKEIEIGKGKMESVEVNELSSKTMKNYIRKAASPVDKRSVGNQASKGAYKLATSDDMDAGEKEDRKSFNRGRGIQRAAKKLYSRTTEETVNELSNDLVDKVAKKRAIKVGSSMMKADGDRRDPEVQKAMAKKKANDSLRFNRGARKMGEDYSDKEVRMGKGVAFDKRYKDGNYSGAYKTINKIKKGLADHPKVKDALRRANEEFNKGE